MTTKARNVSRMMAVVPAMNSEASIANVLFQLWRAKVSAVTVVVNGCTDGTERAVRDAADALFDLEQHGGQPMWVLVAASQSALGIDVPRAVGTYAAMRCDIAWDQLVIVDGDWKGAFGPALEVHLHKIEEDGYDVTWVRDRENARMRTSRPDLDIWNGVLRRKAPDLLGVDAARSPIVIRRSVFQNISPYYLHHPGLWLAHCILARDGAAPTKGKSNRLKLAGLPFDARHLGNPIRSKVHQEKIAETLVGDAIEAKELLNGGHPSREWHGKTWLGYHAERDVGKLSEFSASTAKISGRVIRLN